LIGTLVLALPSAASADITLGSSSVPAGSSSTACPAGLVIAQATSDPSTSYTVPAAGQITQWETNTTNATAGAAVTLVVLKPVGGGSYQVVGIDSRALPTPLPASNVATFTLATPIAVSGGETLGLYGNGSAAICYRSGGSTPGAATLTALSEPAAPAAGQSLSPSGGNSPGGFTMNVAATLVSSQDVGVTSSQPDRVTVGNLALLASSVANGGPVNGPIMFNDTVPDGLTIVSAVAGAGSCSVSGQSVACTVTGLSAGQSAPVNLLVRPTVAQTYANAVSVAPQGGAGDPNVANNSASATLIVDSPPLVGPPPTSTPSCVVPKLTRTPVSVAKNVLGRLSCKIGKTKRVRSKSSSKGTIIKTTPGAGTYRNGTAVNLTVSLGPPKKKSRR
jgi:hypothetical protein